MVPRCSSQTDEVRLLHCPKPSLTTVTEIPIPLPSDPNDRSRRFVVPLGTTSTRVTFRSIELQPKFVQNAAPASDEPPPVLFQGRKQSGKAVPKEKFIEGEPTSKVKGKARGRGRGATAAGRGGPKGRKGKSKDGEDNDEDAYPGSDADGDVNYDDMDGDDDGDGDEGVGSRNEAGPSRAPGPSRRSLRPRNTETQMNEALLGGLQAMDVDDTEDGAGMSEGPS